MKKLFVVALAVGSVALASCANYATKEYVDQQVAGVAEKVNSVDAKLSALEKEVATLKSSGNATSAKVNNLEAQINQMKKTCPEACNRKISALEKDVAELKEKVEKQSAYMEKEVEKSMRK